MSDAGVVAATATATGVLVIPSLVAIGIDPAAMVAGLFGCTMVQTLLPAEKERSIRAIALLTLGGMLFASLFTPIAAPWVVQKVHAAVSEAVHVDPIRAAVAASLGGFAQPLVVLASKLIGRFSGKMAPGKEGGDA